MGPILGSSIIITVCTRFSGRGKLVDGIVTLNGGISALVRYCVGTTDSTARHLNRKKLLGFIGLGI